MGFLTCGGAGQVPRDGEPRGMAAAAGGVGGGAPGGEGDVRHGGAAAQGDLALDHIDFLYVYVNMYLYMLMYVCI